MHSRRKNYLARRSIHERVLYDHCSGWPCFFLRGPCIGGGVQTLHCCGVSLGARPGLSWRSQAQPLLHQPRIAAHHSQLRRGQKMDMCVAFSPQSPTSHASVRSTGLAKSYTDRYRDQVAPPTIATIIKTQGAKQSAAACALRKATREQSDRPTLWAALRSENAASSTIDSTEGIKAQRSIDSMPLIVLNAAHEAVAAPVPQIEKRAIMSAWTTGHERLARLPSVGVPFIIPQSGFSSMLSDQRPLFVQSRKS